MTTDIREGLAKLLSDYSPCGCLDCQDSCHEQADEILTYLRAHDGHASELHTPEHRLFCERHKYRGDCGLDDADRNHIFSDSKDQSNG